MFVDDVNYLSLTDSSLASGQPGVGGYGTVTGNSLGRVGLGAADVTAPGAVGAQSVAVATAPNRVDLQWQGASDDTNGSGVWMYRVYRGGVLGFDNLVGTEIEDASVAPAQSYTYTIYAVDYHGNTSSGTIVSVTTPAAGAIDPRRIGVRGDGAYWGGGGEQIDTRSGNVNFTLPLLKALGRGGWGVGFALSYNSQVWRQVPNGGAFGGVWKLGRDVGYGFGWRVQAGSLTPYWSDSFTIHHYLFTDATGAEYRLDVNNGGIWTSRESTYVEYDAANQRLYFTDGSFWVLGAVSSGAEQDAGTRYPTLIQDPNGNQVVIEYLGGQRSPWSNSSARIMKVEDVRSYRPGGWDTVHSYMFEYADAGAGPHLWRISNIIGTGEKYEFTHAPGQPLAQPFTGTSFGTADLLTGMTQTGQTVSHQFEYEGGAGELTKVTFPYGGALRWDYRTFTYSGVRKLREVAARYLTKSPGAAEDAYAFTRDDAGDAGRTVHSWTVITDPSGPARLWTFDVNTASATVGLLIAYEDRPSTWVAGIRRQDYTWQADTSGRQYISAVLTTLDQGTGSQVQSKTEQTVDVHGNVAQTKRYDYGNLTTPARTYTNTYLTNGNYTSRHIWSRVLTSTVTD